MRRKRFHHIAFTLCHMFCGWQLMADYKRLGKLGSGILFIDARTGRTLFNEQEIEPLSIAQVLQGFLANEAGKMKIHKMLSRRRK